MNIYGLLRVFVEGLSKLGGLSSEKTFDALQLISELEKTGVFGSTAIGMEGKHEYRPTNSMLRDEFNQCAMCHKPYTECEGTK